MRYFISLILIALSGAKAATFADLFPPITPENMDRVAVAAWFDHGPLPFDTISAFAFSPTGSQLAIAQTAQLNLISTNTFEIQHSLQYPDNVQRDIYFLVYSPDGSRTVSFGGPNRNSFSVWDAEQGQYLFSGQVRLRGDALGIWDMAFNPNDTNQVIAYLQYRPVSFISIWDVDSQQEINRVSSQRCYETNSTHSPLCQLFDYFDYEYARVGRVALLIDRLSPPHESCTSALAEFLGYSPDTKRFGVVQSCVRENDDPIYFYQLYQTETGIYQDETYKLLAQHMLDGRYIHALINPDGSLLLDSANDGLWLVNPATLERQSIYPAALSADRNRAQFNYDGSLLGLFTTSNSTLQIYAVFECFVRSTREVNLRTAPTTEAAIGGVLIPDVRFGIYGSETIDGFTWYHVPNDLWVRGDVVDHTCPAKSR